MKVLGEAMQERIAAIKRRCAKATEGPWHYYPCGEKSNDCVLGVAVGEEGCPPGGEVELSPYDEATGEFEMDKYIMDPAIAHQLDHANYSDFCFMAHAREDVPWLVEQLEALLEDSVNWRGKVTHALQPNVPGDISSGRAVELIRDLKSQVNDSWAKYQDCAQAYRKAQDKVDALKAAITRQQA